MDKENILKLVAEPLFWLCSVIFSIILGVFSNLLTPHISNYLDKKFASRKETKRRKQLRLLGQVIVIFDKPQEIMNSKLDSLHGFAVAILILVLSLFALLFGFLIQIYVKQWVLLTISYFLSSVGVLLTWLGLYAASHGFDKIQIIRTAESRKRAAFDYSKQKGIEFESKEMLEFYDNWDKKNIGVTMQEVVDDIQGRKAKTSA